MRSRWLVYLLLLAPVAVSGYATWAWETRSVSAMIAPGLYLHAIDDDILLTTVDSPLPSITWDWIRVEPDPDTWEAARFAQRFRAVGTRHEYTLPPGVPRPRVSVLLRDWTLDLLLPLAALPLLILGIVRLRKWRRWHRTTTAAAFVALFAMIAGNTCGATCYRAWYSVGWSHGRIAIGLRTEVPRGPYYGFVGGRWVRSESPLGYYAIDDHVHEARHALNARRLWPEVHTWNRWTYLHLPVWLVAGAPLLVLDRYLNRRPRPNECSGCNYDLTGNATGTCPECGQRRDSTETLKDGTQ